MASEQYITVCYDPFIKRMARHSVAMPEFKKKMKEMMDSGQAFVTQTKGARVTMHPSDALLDEFYAAMGLENEKL